MAEFRLETDRLVLREWRGDDLAALHALCTDTEVMKTIGPLSTEEQSRTLLSRLQDRQASFGFTFWPMERKSDSSVIGFCGASRGMIPQIEDKVEIGWRLRSDCWGKSYAHEAAKATLGWVARERPGEAAWAITSIGNKRSRALMERLGMQYCPGMDFPHPQVADESHLKQHVTYVLEDLSDYTA